MQKSVLRNFTKFTGKTPVPETTSSKIYFITVLRQQRTLKWAGP